MRASWLVGAAGGMQRKSLSPYKVFASTKAQTKVRQPGFKSWLVLGGLGRQPCYSVPQFPHLLKGWEKCCGVSIPLLCLRTPEGTQPAALKGSFNWLSSHPQKTTWYEVATGCDLDQSLSRLVLPGVFYLEVKLPMHGTVSSSYKLRGLLDVQLPGTTKGLQTTRCL